MVSPSSPVPRKQSGPTPRSKRLGRELRRLREARGLKLEEVAALVDSSDSRISRIESGNIKLRRGAAIELLDAYGVPADSEDRRWLLDLARDLRESGWWQRLDALSSKYATYIAYEAEAALMRHWEPTLIPGLLQTREYAREVISVGRETDAGAIDQLTEARLTRQDVLTREPLPLRLHAILSEAALSQVVGSAEVMRAQLEHIVTLSRLPNVTVQVLRFAAGAHGASRGGLVVLDFDRDDPPLGYVETPVGGLFVESSREIQRLTSTYNHLLALAMSPAESTEWMKEKASGT